jgi:hypothetical protein
MSAAFRSGGTKISAPAGQDFHRAAGVLAGVCVPARSGPDVFQVLEQAEVRRVPAEGVAGAGTGRWLVHREDRAERTEVLLRYRPGWQAQAAADDCCDVSNRVTQPVQGVPGAGGALSVLGPGRVHESMIAAKLVAPVSK